MLYCEYTTWNHCYLMTIGATYTSYLTHEIARIDAFMSAVSFTGVLVLRATLSGTISLLGVYLSTVMVPYIMTLVSCTWNVGGYIKKAFYNAYIFIALCVGNFIGPLITFGRECKAIIICTYYTRKKLSTMLSTC